jgi:hypothetical protein
VSLTTCNGCGGSLVGVVESKTANVFAGFCHGVARGPFPFRASARLETERLLVFDDPLALTPCHVCAIPTDVHVPSACTLFLHPRRGARVLRSLEAGAWAAVEGAFLKDAAFVEAVYGKDAPPPAAAALRSRAIAGMNVPPSQYQLHLQYLIPPLLPSQYAMYRAGTHFTKGRFLPLAYLLDALDALANAGKAVPDAEALDGAALAARVADLVGVDYDAAWEKAYARVEESQNALGAWDPGDFAYAVSDDGAVAALAGGAVSAPAAADLARADKAALSTYDAGGVFYKYPRAAPLPELGDLPDDAQGL